MRRRELCHVSQHLCMALKPLATAAVGESIQRQSSHFSISGVKAGCYRICPMRFAACRCSGSAHLIVIYARLADRAYPAVALHLHPPIEARPAVEMPTGSRKLWSDSDDKAAGQTLGLLPRFPPAATAQIDTLWG